MCAHNRYTVEGKSIPFFACPVSYNLQFRLVTPRQQNHNIYIVTNQFFAPLNPIFVREKGFVEEKFDEVNAELQKDMCIRREFREGI